MTDKITGNEIAEWLHANRKNAAWLAKKLGVAPSTPTRWIKGSEIPEPSEKLLRLLIRGEIPFGMLPPRSGSQLEFTPREWRIIELARCREGFDSATDWIVSKIRIYIKMADLDVRPAEGENLEALPEVADEEYPYPNGTEGKASGE